MFFGLPSLEGVFVSFMTCTAIVIILAISPDLIYTQPTTPRLVYFVTCTSQKFHPLFMGTADIGPAVNHFQEITAQYPEVRTTGRELL